MKKHTILFLAANPSGTAHVALDEEARAIREALERSRYRNRFKFVTRWAVESTDLLRELHRLKPSIVHFSGHGVGNSADEAPSSDAPRRDVLDRPDSHHGEQRQGLLFVGPDSYSRFVSLAALKEAFHAAGSSVKLLVLNACHSSAPADALPDVDCIVGMAGSVEDEAAKSFAISFYASLGERASVTAAYESGRAAINLAGLADHDRPQLRVRAGVDPDHIVFASHRARPNGALVQHVQPRWKLRGTGLAIRAIAGSAFAGLAVASYLYLRPRTTHPLPFDAVIHAHGPPGDTGPACSHGTVLMTLGNEHREATIWQGMAHLTVAPPFEGFPLPAIVTCHGFLDSTTSVVARRGQPIEVVMTRSPPPRPPDPPPPPPFDAVIHPHGPQGTADLACVRGTVRVTLGNEHREATIRQGIASLTVAREFEDLPIPATVTCDGFFDSTTKIALHRGRPTDVAMVPRPRPPPPPASHPRRVRICSWTSTRNVIEARGEGCRPLSRTSENVRAYDLVMEYQHKNGCQCDEILECK